MATIDSVHLTPARENKQACYPLALRSGQDIRALELRINETVEEYLDSPGSYNNPVLHIYLDNDRMEYQAEIAENLPINDDDGVYAIENVVREGDEGLEPDNDRVSDIANSWIFLD